MRLSSVPVILGVAATATARHTPRSPDQPLVHLHDLVARDFDCPTLEQDAIGRVPYFAFEERDLSSANSLHKLLRPGSNSTAASNGTLKGPGDCKVFPGDDNWPSSQDWAALDDATGNALLKPQPQAHICYGNGTGNASGSAACLDMTERWTDPFTQ